MTENKHLANWLLHDVPVDQDEAIEKWRLISKVLQLITLVYNVPDEKVEQAISLCEDLKD